LRIAYYYQLSYHSSTKFVFLKLSLIMILTYKPFHIRDITTKFPPLPLRFHFLLIQHFHFQFHTLLIFYFLWSLFILISLSLLINFTDSHVNFKSNQNSGIILQLVINSLISNFHFKIKVNFFFLSFEIC
jgi:hypothetical protein